MFLCWLLLLPDPLLEGYEEWWSYYYSRDVLGLLPLESGFYCGALWMWLEKRLFSVVSEVIWFSECGWAGVYRLFTEDFIFACELFAFLAVESSLWILNYFIGTFSSMP